MFAKTAVLLVIFGNILSGDCAVNLVDIGSGEAAAPPLEETPLFNDVQVWRMTSTSDGSLPTCQHGKLKGAFVTEMCHLVQDPYLNAEIRGTNPLVVFQYCNCPQGSACSVSPRYDDPFTYVTLGFLQYKTCAPLHAIPECKLNEYGIVAKIWYGEDLPQRALIHCRCPSAHAWGAPRCTSSGRICYILRCNQI